MNADETSLSISRKKTQIILKCKQIPLFLTSDDNCSHSYMDDSFQPLINSVISNGTMIHPQWHTAIDFQVQRQRNYYWVVFNNFNHIYFFNRLKLTFEIMKKSKALKQIQILSFENIYHIEMTRGTFMLIHWFCFVYKWYKFRLFVFFFSLNIEKYGQNPQYFKISVNYFYLNLSNFQLKHKKSSDSANFLSKCSNCINPQMNLKSKTLKQ